MILCDGDIKEEIERKRIVIEPFDEKSLTPNGYDLTIEDVRSLKKERKVKAKEWFLVSTKEYIILPNDVCAQLWIRSSFARKGIFCSFGKVDAGFEGTLTIGCFNANNNEIEIKRGERFIQIIFERMSSGAEKAYSGKYKGQKGIKTE